MGTINPLNAELNPICHLLALLGAHHILHVGGLRVKGIILKCLETYQAFCSICRSESVLASITYKSPFGLLISQLVGYK
jgi:hypothetical protein